MIWEELKESLIFFNIKEREEKEILKIMGEVLICEGYAKPNYVQALVEREKDFPTGLKIQNIGVAIPHTDAKYVKKEGIAIAVLRDPVTFGLMGEEKKRIPVRIVFMLALLDPNTHVEYLQRILSLIQDVEVLKALLVAEDYTEIVQTIKEKENLL